jgi:Tfp pilus assembly protein PilP
MMEKRNPAAEGSARGAREATNKTVDSPAGEQSKQIIAARVYSRVGRRRRLLGTIRRTDGSDAFYCLDDKGITVGAGRYIGLKAAIDAIWSHRRRMP